MPTIARVDTESLFEALDRERRKRRMTRKDLCAELGVTGSSYCGWSHGLGISGAAIASISCWLDVDLRDYVAKDEG